MIVSCGNISTINEINVNQQTAAVISSNIFNDNILEIEQHNQNQAITSDIQNPSLEGNHRQEEGAHPAAIQNNQIQEQNQQQVISFANNNLLNPDPNPAATATSANTHPPQNILEGQVSPLQALALPVQSKLVQEKHIQSMIILCQAFSILSSIIYFSVAQDIFSSDYSSDILMLIGSCLNILSIIQRYQLIQVLKSIMSNLVKYHKQPNKPNPSSDHSHSHSCTKSSVLFLIAVRDEISMITSINKLTRAGLHGCLEKTVCHSQFDFLKSLNTLLSLLLIIPLYIIINHTEYAHKITGNSNIIVLIILCICSILIQACYCLLHILAAAVMLVVVVVVSGLFLVGAAIYYFFLGTALAIQYCIRKICRRRNNDVNSADAVVFPQSNLMRSSSNNRLKLQQRIAEKYVKNNSQEICFSLLTSKDSLCAICLEEFPDQKMNVQQMLCCNSPFHLGCLVRWAQVNKSCPSCRADQIQLLKQQKLRELNRLAKETQQRNDSAAVVVPVSVEASNKVDLQGSNQLQMIANNNNNIGLSLETTELNRAQQNNDKGIIQSQNPPENQQNIEQIAQPTEIQRQELRLDNVEQNNQST